jgi:hypothetical protein
VAALIVLVMLTNALCGPCGRAPGAADRILGAGFGVLCAWAAMGMAFLFYTYPGRRRCRRRSRPGDFPLIKEMAISSSPTCRRASDPPAAAAEHRPVVDPATQIPSPADTKPPQ